MPKKNTPAGESGVGGGGGGLVGFWFVHVISKSR